MVHLWALNSSAQTAPYALTLGLGCISGCFKVACEGGGKKTLASLLDFSFIQGEEGPRGRESEGSCLWVW